MEIKLRLSGFLPLLNVFVYTPHPSGDEISQQVRRLSLPLLQNPMYENGKTFCKLQNRFYL